MLPVTKIVGMRSNSATPIQNRLKSSAATSAKAIVLKAKMANVTSGRNEKTTCDAMKA